METEHAAALFHLREALEKTEACPNLLIEARSSFKKGLVILENKADKINEGYEIHENMKKIQKAVEVLKKLLNELESSVVTETQRVTVRETKISGRNADSGVVLSRGSSFLSSDNEDDSNKASITSIRSDSSTWNVHVNDLSGQSPVLDNRVPEVHGHLLSLLKPEDEHTQETPENIGTPGDEGQCFH